MISYKSKNYGFFLWDVNNLSYNKIKYYRVENQRVPSTLTWKRKVLCLENNQGELWT